MRNLVIASLVLLLSACSVVPAPRPLQAEQSGTVPDDREEHSAMVGDVILSTYAYRAIRFAVLQEEVPAIVRSEEGAEKTVMGYLFGGDGSDQTAPIAVGTRLQESRLEDGETAFCAYRRCLKDTDDDGALDRELIVATREGVLEVRDGLDIAYKIDDDIEETKDSVKRDLVYQGRGSDTIKIAYREFQDGRFARPAFFQDLSYQLAEEGPTSIGFRSARIEVLEATNTEIRYRVISGLQ